jgi:hypothetical protein
MHTMRFPLAMLAAAGLCAAATGCRSNGHRVEDELRKRETDVRDLREELDQCATHNRALQMELQAVGVGASHSGDLPFPVRSLTLGRQTGGRELEGTPGDGALQVVLEPRDAEGHAIKIPNAGAIIQVAEVGPEGLKHPLSMWEIPPEQLRSYWRSGLLTTGYVLVLPWKVPPSTEKLRVVALLRLADGRAFEADKDVTIRLPGLKPRFMPPVTPSAPPTDGPELPAPRPVDPGLKLDAVPASIGRPVP